MNSLALQALKRDPRVGDLVVFFGRRGNLVKMLWHDTVGMGCRSTRSGWSAASSSPMAFVKR
jgi:transposase